MLEYSQRNWVLAIQMDYTDGRPELQHCGERRQEREGGEDGERERGEREMGRERGGRGWRKRHRGREGEMEGWNQ